MKNLQKPISWSYLGILLYGLLLSTFALIFLESSFLQRLIFITLDIALIALYIFFLSRPNLAEKQFLVIFPLSLSLIWLCVGTVVLYTILDSPPVIYSRQFMDNHSTQYFAFAVAAMLPFGIVIFVLSMISLILMRSKKFG